MNDDIKFVGCVKDGIYHGIMHSHELNLMSMRIPKSACSYLRRWVFSGVQEVHYDELNRVDKTRPYEVFESMPFDCEYIRQTANIPMIIFVREPLERCCSGLAEIMNTSFRLPDSEIPDGYFERLEHNSNLYKQYPLTIDSILMDIISASDNIYDLWALGKYKSKFGSSRERIRENHLVPQTYWISEIMKVRDNIVFFEVNDYLHHNVEHFISNHIGKTFDPGGTRANNSYDKPISMFIKSYLKAKICDEASNSPLRQSALEIYDKDIELYNSLKSRFYTQGQQNVLVS